MASPPNRDHVQQLPKVYGVDLGHEAEFFGIRVVERLASQHHQVHQGLMAEIRRELELI